MKKTKLWLIRHAPVTANKGKLYGQEDFPCDCSNSAQMTKLAERLPDDGVWIASNLIRTHQTAAAIAEAGGFPLPDLQKEPDLAEQDFGDWQGRTWDELHADNEGNVVLEFWRRPSTVCPPNGESFVELRNRVDQVITQVLKDHAGKNIILSLHGGTIRAILARALNIDSDSAINISIANLSLSTLTHFKLDDGDAWRIEGVNWL